MTNHYYSNKPTVQSNRKKWEYKLKGKTYTFQSDNGVFSKNEIDFGSRLLIETFEIPEVEGDILDVGCGYGPIGLTIADNFKRHVDMIDINERAVELAMDNAKLNKIENVNIFQSDLLDKVDKNKKYCAIVTNPPIRAGKDVVFQIFEASYNQLKTSGELWIVIQKKQGAPSAINKLEELFTSVETVEKKKGYFIIKSIK
ncbi:class I SAM-dependent methyltransferase [Metabacillus malikii]|uniref:16S rRNA (Guanine1207-N2)-methyltransferase n=1 Tax=Metabacillus malikii TaxID=1504265 RepID=A0ABT9ZL23_9BACI|nr:class I SAM-dependent methyltransferase [Metabacillus malikii]MDQ0232996.1 16S rRNA (guanine1207-N2)-methyltransferase [Metabacillus malikii]